MYLRWQCYKWILRTNLYKDDAYTDLLQYMYKENETSIYKIEINSE